MLWKVTRVKHFAETVKHAGGDRDTADLLVFTFPFSVSLFFPHLFMMTVAIQC
jgi:hypothetical protein